MQTIFSETGDSPMGLLPSWSATDALVLQRCVGSSCKRQ